VNGYQTAGPARRPRRRGRTILIILIILIALLVALDFGARAFAESKVASEIQTQGFPNKPDVSIQGYPFLTQVASRDMKRIEISSTDVPVGPVTIHSIDAVLNGVHINSSFNGGTVDTLTGTAQITFGELANSLASQVGPLGSLGGPGLTLKAAGPDEVKASLDLLITSGSATWKVTRLSGDKLGVQLVSSNGLPSELLNSIRNITVPLSGLPLHLQIDSVSVNDSGIIGTLSGKNVTFGG
jgi:LmeA-like phospholipid-binding